MNNVSQMKYNSQELMNMANYLKNHVDTGFVSQVNNILANLPAEWQGPAADAFVAKITALVKQIQDYKVQQYNLMANRLGQTATDLEQATASLISGINKF